jgi:hypothetical protein
VSSGIGVSRGDRNRNDVWLGFAGWCRSLTRSSGSTWPMRRTWSWSPIMTRGCWLAGRFGATPGIRVSRLTGPVRTRQGRKMVVLALRRSGISVPSP